MPSAGRCGNWRPPVTSSVTSYGTGRAASVTPSTSSTSSPSPKRRICPTRILLAQIRLHQIRKTRIWINRIASKPISSVASELLTPEQLEMYQVYRQTLGNKPLIFGGGSADTSDSESLAGVEFVNGTRPGNQAVVDIAKSQVGNVGGQPYWSWYGFTSRVEWCACYVSWCYGQMGLSEPRFAACQSQGIPWFQSHGQWGGRDYANIAPGDAIFFDWDLDGSADHVGIVVGTDGSRVYTVEGNSGDACKIKSYSLTYECIKGYGLMNW